MSSAGDFVRANPGLRAAMAASEGFARIREGALLAVDDEQLYIVKGDTLGDEDDLYLETLVRGAHASTPDDPHRAVFLELDDDLQAIVRSRAGAPAQGDKGELE